MPVRLGEARLGVNNSASSGPIFKISSATLQSLYFPGHEGV